MYWRYKPKLVSVKSSGPDAEKYLCHYGSGSEHFELHLYKSRRFSGLMFEVYFKPEGPNICGRNDELSRVGWWSKKGIHGLGVDPRVRGQHSVSPSIWYFVSVYIDNHGQFAFLVYPNTDERTVVREYDADLNSREITFDEFKRKYADMAKGRDPDLFPSAANIKLLLEDLARAGGKSDRLWDYAYKLVKEKIPSLPPLE